MNLKKTVVKTLKKDASTGAYSDHKESKVARGTQRSSKSNSATTSEQIVDQLEELLESTTEQDKHRNGGCQTSQMSADSKGKSKIMSQTSFRVMNSVYQDANSRNRAQAREANYTKTTVAANTEEEQVESDHSIEEIKQQIDDLKKLRDSSASPDKVPIKL